MATDKKISYKDQRLTKAQQKKAKAVKQAGIKNFLGKQKTVTVPKKWLSSSDHVVAELAYITPKEQKILLDANLYGSLNGQPNRGPGGIMSLQGAGDGGGSEDKGTNDDGSNNSGYDVQADLTDYATNVGKTAKSTGGFKGGFGDAVKDGVKTIGTKVKDYVMGGGMLGVGIRGLGSLVNKFSGPKATEYGNLDIPGYNMLNIAGPKSYNFGPEDGSGNDDGNQGIMAAYNPYILPVEEVPVSQKEEDFVQRFRGFNRTRQDKQGQLDPAILEMISKLYT